MKTIGVISDTHGLLRPEVLAALQGSDLIVHAGDIGSPDVKEPRSLDALAMKPRMGAMRGCPFGQELELASTGATLTGQDFFWTIAKPLAEFEPDKEAIAMATDAWTRFLREGTQRRTPRGEMFGPASTGSKTAACSGRGRGRSLWEERSDRELNDEISRLISPGAADSSSRVGVSDRRRFAHAIFGA